MPNGSVPAEIELISIVSHELRTPLTSILGYLNVLIEDTKNLTDEQKKFLNTTLVAAQQMASLINNLLNVSRVERGVFTVSPKPNDLHKILSQSIAEHELQAAQKSISLSLDLKEQTQILPLVMADESRIMEVLNNLVDNAIKYTTAGGVVKVSSQLIGGEVITAITDNGPGISKETVEHLFTKFYGKAGGQEGPSSTKGLGLGLYLSRLIVELHHGRIWVESKIGEGSTFYFSLPVAKVNQGSLPSPSQASTASSLSNEL